MQWKKRLLLLVVLVFSLCLLFSAGAAYAANDEPETIAVGDIKLQLIHHDESLVPDRGHAGFCALLFDTDGRLALEDGRTWLYTTGLFEAPIEGLRDWYGKWVSHARTFNPESLVSGEKELALGLAPADQWAVIHHAIKVEDDLYVVFYSTNKGVRAAVSSQPNTGFYTAPDFEITPTEPWELEGGEGASLESAGGHVKIRENEDEFVFWLIYDSYNVNTRVGQLGWAKVRLDKHSRYLELIEKHPNNPLDLLPQGYLAARAGGNVGSDVKIDGKHTLFYFTRPDAATYNLMVALATDELFQNIVETVQIGGPLGTEEIIEKFEAYILDDILYIIYENRLADKTWQTGIRLYQIIDE